MDFLDVTLKPRNSIYQPFKIKKKKTSDNPLCIHTSSKHPLSINKARTLAAEVYSTTFQKESFLTKPKTERY